MGKNIDPANTGRCAKQTVVATIVTKRGDSYSSTNYCFNPQDTCPRADLPTGVGYDKCKDICQQTEHAEVNVVRNLPGDLLADATLYLQGHTYACDNCQSVALEAGVEEIIIGAPPC